MGHINNEKRKRQITEGIELPNQERTERLKKRKITSNYGSGHPQTSGDKRKDNKGHHTRTRNLKPSSATGISSKE